MGTPRVFASARRLRCSGVCVQDHRPMGGLDIGPACERAALKGRLPSVCMREVGGKHLLLLCMRSRTEGFSTGILVSAVPGGSTPAPLLVARYLAPRYAWQVASPSQWTVRDFPRVDLGL